MKKADITKTGLVVREPEGQVTITGWAFNDMEAVPGIKYQSDGEAYIYGYSTSELAEISAVALWWTCFQFDFVWSGAIHGITWDELWPDAKARLIEIFRSAQSPRNDRAI